LEEPGTGFSRGRSEPLLPWPLRRPIIRTPAEAGSPHEESRAPAPDAQKRRSGASAERSASAASPALPRKPGRVALFPAWLAKHGATGVKFDVGAALLSSRSAPLTCQGAVGRRVAAQPRAALPRPAG
jgi:hypothetical protein